MGDLLVFGVQIWIWENIWTWIWISQGPPLWILTLIRRQLAIMGYIGICFLLCGSRIPSRRGHQPSGGHQQTIWPYFPKICTKLRNFGSNFVNLRTILRYIWPNKEVTLPYSFGWVLPKSHSPVAPGRHPLRVQIPSFSRSFRQKLQK